MKNYVEDCLDLEPDWSATVWSLEYALGQYLIKGRGAQIVAGTATLALQVPAMDLHYVSLNWVTTLNEYLRYMRIDWKVTDVKENRLILECIDLDDMVNLGTPYEPGAS